MALVISIMIFNINTLKFGLHVIEYFFAASSQDSVSLFMQTLISSENFYFIISFMCSVVILKDLIMWMLDHLDLIIHITDHFSYIYISVSFWSNSFKISTTTMKTPWDQGLICLTCLQCLHVIQKRQQRRHLNNIYWIKWMNYWCACSDLFSAVQYLPYYFWPLVIF